MDLTLCASRAERLCVIRTLAEKDIFYEKNLAAKTNTTTADSWLPGQNGDPRRQGSAQSASPKGSVSHRDLI